MVDERFLALVAMLKTSLPLEQKADELQQKGHLDFVTNLDLALDQFITKAIADLFPDDEVVSEERWSTQAETAERLWVIDPLDGTSNAVSALPFYSASIAQIDGAGLRFGLVIDWLHQEIFYAERGQGAFLNGSAISTGHNPASFLGISTGFLRAHGDKLDGLGEKVKFRLLGSQALHLCYVACGRLRGAINLESKVWDDLAGALIVEEAGGFYKSLADFELERPALWGGQFQSAGLALGDKHDSLCALLDVKIGK